MKEMTLKEIEKALGYEIKIIADKPGRKLADIAVGETFKVGELEFVVLEHSKDTTAVILKNCWKRATFDSSSNNYADSEIRKELNTAFYDTLVPLVGKDNIIKHTIDLTSDDGRKEYENVDDFVSLLTCDLFRRYVYILDKYKPGMWWWLATAYSTKSNGCTTSVRCVDDDNTVNYGDCNIEYGVRPFCILKSDIFVSE